MGVLDDAIREHLDLKRARGADPAEIERMEREALGPVRREPTLGSVRVDTVDEPPFPEPEFHDEHLTELEDLQELGYHDSTAPHPHHHAHPHDEHFDPAHDLDARAEALAQELQELEQPKRRFLRRNRPASLAAEPAPLPDPDFYDEPPTQLHDAADHAEPLGHDEPRQPPPPPPQLQFDHPPKRPRFTAEPPSLRPETSEHPEPEPEPETSEHPLADAEPQDAASTHAPAKADEPEAPDPEAPRSAVPEPSAPAHPAPEYEHFDESPGDAADAQETTEFDVQKHMSEPSPEPDEDMLEETPDFLQDTPEHDRLWFEQRPPKDFDF